MMYNEKTGRFIAEMRKEKGLTQKQVAERLFITDKAVSKWERGLSLPDISFLQSLADVLGVTVSELLNGERAVTEVDRTRVSVDNTLDYAEEARKITTKKILNICAIAYSAMLIVGIVTCAICNLAISKTLTWSLIPISASVYAWFIFFPAIKFGSKGILPSMILLSTLTIPFIYILDCLIENGGQLMPIGSIMSLVSIIFFWIIYVAFRIGKKRPCLVAAVLFLVGIPLSVIINCILSKFMSEPMIDVWDFMSFGILVVISVVFFMLDKKTNSRNL